MAEQEPIYSDDEGGWPRIRFAANLLSYVAIALAVVAVVAAAVELVALSRDEFRTSSAYVSVLRSLCTGLGLAALLWGLAELLRWHDDLPHLLPGAAARESRPTLSFSSHARADSPEPLTAGALSELAVLLREVRDISLLNQEERSMRLRSQAEEAARELEKTVPELLRNHNWVEARRRVQVARERFPAQPVWDELEKRIEGVRAGVEARDIEAARRQVHDLASLGAWERAFDVVRDLLERHPGSDAARELARFVQEQRGKADAEQRARLMVQVQEAVKRREWTSALTAASAVIKQYPNSPDAEALRVDLPTLMANAEIQTRKQMEQQITDLTRSRRYGEALQLARELIERYPKSPQAEVLAQKLPQLEAMATNRNRR